MFIYKNIFNNVNVIVDCMKFIYKDKLCIFVLFFYCFGFVLGISVCVIKGVIMVLFDYFNFFKVMEIVYFEKCIGLYGVFIMFIVILQYFEFDKFDFFFFWIGIMVGVFCFIKVMREVVEKMNMKEIIIVYG